VSVNSVCSLGASSFDRQLAANVAIQGVFADVLAAAGMQGYISAGTIASDAEATPTEISQSWQDWVTNVGGSRYANREDSTQVVSKYNELLLKAQQQNAYAAPRAFLTQLDSSELGTLQRINNLAQPIDLNGLSDEGSLNLLLPPPTQVDLNGDGLTETGAATLIRFPDSRTSREVVDAWNTATRNLPPSEKMLRELQMKQEILLANIHVDAEGRVTRVEPGQPGFVNPQADPKYSFIGLATRTLESLDYFRYQTPPEQYARDRDFWSAGHMI
jgi:hypothetical protein